METMMKGYKNWLLITLLIAALSFISTAWAGFQDPISGHVFTLQFYSHFLQFPAAGLLLIPVTTLLLPPKLRARISNPGIGMATIAALTVLFVTSGVYFPWKVVEGFWQARLATAYRHNELLPSHWAPSQSFMTQVRNNQVIPWSEFAPEMINWITFTIVWYFYFISFVNLLRRRWIDIEELPYPYTSTSTTLIEAGSPEATKKKRIILVGLVVALIVYAPYILGTYFPWFPKIYGWGVAPFMSGERYAILDDTRAFPGWASVVVGCLGITTEPLVYGLLYLMPIDTLFTMAVFWLIFLMIFPQVGYTLGYYPGIFTQDALTRRNTLSMVPPLNFEAFSGLGLLPGLIIFNLIFNWRYIAETVRMALGTVKGESREEANEPISYRLNYLIMIFSSIGVLIWLSAAGLGPIAAPLMLLVTFIDTMGWSRTVGMAGPAPSGWSHGCGYFKWIWPGITREDQVTREYVMTMTTIGKGPLASVYVSPPQFAAFAGLMSYKIGRQTGIRNRDVFKVMTLAVILGSVISVVTMHVLVQTYGWMRLPVTKESDYLAQGTLSFVGPRPAAEPWWPWAVAGFVLCGLMSYMRMRFIWFPLDPIGATIITQRNGYGAGIGYPVVIALAAKYITIKVGGAKSYEDYGLPFVIGLISGQVIMALIGGFMATYRFFVPI